MDNTKKVANKKTTNKKVVTKKTSKTDIMKQLKNPNLSDSERARLTEKLYDGVEFKKKKK